MQALPIVPILIIFPFLVGAVLFCIPAVNVRKVIAYFSSAVIIIGVFILLFQWLAAGAETQILYYDTHFVDTLILIGELLLMCLVVFLCFKYKKYWICILSVVPTIMMVYLELAGPEMPEVGKIYLDHLSILMCLIVGVIGSLIIVYGAGYMDGYQIHRPDVPDRRRYFFMLLFCFLGAMFGLVLSESLLWIVFFWEGTSICSFLLIGYTREDVAITNSFRALWMNLLGGTAMTIGVCYFAYNYGSVSLHELVKVGIEHNAVSVIPIALIAFAALTKSAQLPFSTWLIGAMVAPTPSSALLHSATMVKAGIYILFRLSPAMNDTLTGSMISVIGGFTFILTSLMAIAQTDAKKVLAFSTISNLGLMAACAGMGRMETVWAGVFLMIFHAISKSLLFQDVGAAENVLHSRDIEDMHGLFYILPRIAFFMFIGIAGMFLAPFGMLIAKWSALKASVDTGNVLMVFFIAFGSATTSFYWTKWMGKLISMSHLREKTFKDITKKNEIISLSLHAIMMILLCLLFPLISQVYVNPLLEEMFGSASDVLPQSILFMLIIIIILIFTVPVFAFLYSAKSKSNIKLSYMNGINKGDNRFFIDSFGEPKRLWLSNYYFHRKIGQRKLMVPGQLFSMALLIIMMIMIIGGAAV